MGTEGPPDHALEEALDVFSGRDGSREPLTASEVADELDCARRTAYDRLEALADRGELSTKKVGARGRVWWRPAESDDESATETRGRENPEAGVDTETGIERAQFRELVDAVTDYAIFVLDAEGHVRTWNEGARRLKGYEEEEIVGEHFSVFYTEEDREAGRPAENLSKTAAEGRVEDEGWRVRDDGSTFWANVTMTALYDDDGDVRGFIKITQDMTERREYEQRLREQKERFETLVQEVTDYAIFLLDDEGYVRTWNEGARQLKGYEEEEIVGEHFSVFYTEEDREAGRPAKNLEAAKRHGRVEDERWRVRDDGSTFWANVTITALYDDDGDVRGFAKITRDMTERHEYEQRLREQRDELDELDQINTVIRNIDQALVTATSREEIEQAVCDRLAASEPYAAAWIGEYADDYATISPRTWTGLDERYLDTVRSESGSEAAEKRAGATALQSRSIQSVQEFRDDAGTDPGRDDVLGDAYVSAIAVPLVYEDVEYGVLVVYADHESAFDQRKTDVMRELGETISHAIAAVRRKEREQTLTALQESTRGLFHAETRDEIGDVIVETLTDDLGLDGAVVYAFDTAENRLEPVGSSRGDGSAAVQPTVLDAESTSPAWTGFVEGETRVVDAVVPPGHDEGEESGDDGDGDQQTVIAPLGDHGVLTAALADARTDEETLKLVELVAATAEAAFDRVEQRANLRERDELLQEQNQRLQRLNQINTIIREIDQGLVRATTREEIERVVCEQLTRRDRFRFAWIGAAAETDERLRPVARSGTDRGYLDSVDLSVDVTGVGEPATVAVRTGETTVVSNVAEELHSGEWRSEAFSREFHSIICVPLRYGDVSYGVLSVYADRSGVFDEMEQSVFTELGETIANTINAVETKRALLSDQVVELEFRLRDASESVLGRFADAADCEIGFRGAIPLSGDRTRLFFDARGVSTEEVRAALDRSVAVESSRILGGDGDEHRVEAVVTESTVALALTEFGASLRTFSVTDDGVRFTADVPTSVDVREFAERFQSRYESAEFVARRERERSTRTRGGLEAELDDYLTDRQREVLETAYYSGFFHTPRQSTGSDVADLLDVSQPTVSEQLRTAQRKVLDLLFDEKSVDASR